ncbi:MAG TPA: FHA domain-containing protein [Anaerolineae bacterium]|nr:FHA domain-containing protein [Anaerolineae bacterium]
MIHLQLPPHTIKSQPYLLLLLCSFLLTLLIPASSAHAQGPTSQLFITGYDTTYLPAVTLQVYGRDAQGQPLTFDQQALSLTHDGNPVTNPQLTGLTPVGTFTIFIIDVPPGVNDQLNAMQQAIETFAAPPNMQEQLDHIAIYRVGDTQAEPLLETTSFYNSVRNLFAIPLSTQTGLTALYDSVATVLNDIPTLKPQPDMATQIIVMSDGTDAISNQYTGDDLIARANAVGVPVHTVVLRNVNLSPQGQETGNNYLNTLATSTGGLSTTLGPNGDLQPIWDNIALFRQHALITYQLETMTGGSVPVNLTLTDLNLSATTLVEIPSGAPMITLNIPPENRTLTLPELPTPESPLNLRFQTSYSWLDNAERQPLRANIFLNGATLADIDIDNLNDFTIDIDNLVYGPNQLQLVMIDDAGQQAISDIITLQVVEGEETIIPEPLQGDRFSSGSGGSLLTFCFWGLAFILILLALVMWWFRIRIPWLEDLWYQTPWGRNNAPRPRSRIPNLSPEPTSLDPTPSLPSDNDTFLEILAAISALPTHIPLTGSEVRLGRSELNADIIFAQDPTVSRLHATLILDTNGYRLYDEGSRSGTLVNGIPVPAHGMTLIDGDEIHIGAVHLRFRQP